MNILLSADDRYAIPTGTCMASILENNKDSFITFYILSSGITDENKCKFKEFEGKWNCKVIVKEITDTRFDEIYTSDRYPKSVYFRALAPDVVDGDRCIYMDGDIIVRGSLKSMYNTNLEGYAMGAIEDCCGDDIRRKNKIGVYGFYFNTGVLLMNLDYWRKNNVCGQMIKLVRDNRRMFSSLPDQDALNIVLFKKVKPLHYVFNFQSNFYEKLTPSNRLLSNQKWEIIQNTKSQAVVIHYTDNAKPWHIECKHPMLMLYRQYAKLTPWGAQPLTHMSDRKLRKLPNPTVDISKLRK